MNVLVTGAYGFIGRNLCLELSNRGHTVLEYDRDVTLATLQTYIAKADCLIHLAGINRPLTTEEFYDGNVNFTVQLIKLIKDSRRRIPVIFSSTIQAELANDYGQSKRMAEQLLFDFMKDTGIPVAIYRLSNVFGKWCRPNYNSVVATFCHNIAHNLPIDIRDPEHVINLVYIDDVVDSFISMITKIDQVTYGKIFEATPITPISLGQLADKLRDFHHIRQSFYTPAFASVLDHKLYATFLSYYDSADYIYDLKMNADQRGSFTEIIKTINDGQFSVNISKPGITKGNHYHHTKTEKFIVVSGQCEIKMRKIGTEDIIVYHVDGTRLQVIDIPPGYTHSIKNIGEQDSITIMWASEVFNHEAPDTYFEEVEKNAR